MPVADPRPPGALDAEDDVGLRPDADRDEDGAAIAEAGGEPSRIGVPHPPAWSERDDGVHLGDGRGDGEPLVAGPWDEDEPPELDAGALRRLDPEVRQPDDPAPRARGRWRREERREQHAARRDGHDRAGLEAPVEQPRERRMHRHEPLGRATGRRSSARRRRSTSARGSPPQRGSARDSRDPVHRAIFDTCSKDATCHRHRSPRVVCARLPLGGRIRPPSPTRPSAPAR